MIVFFSCSSEQKKNIYSDDKSDIKSYNLIDPIVAAQLISDNSKKYIPIQVSKNEVYLKEHIPNALNIWRPDYASDVISPIGGLIPSKQKLESLLQQFGFAEGTTLLLYDVKANVDALRFAWVLKLYGFDDFKIINGGLKYWKLNNLELTKELTQAKENTKFKLKDYFDHSIIADFDEVLASIKDTNIVLIDTREEYEFKGMPFSINGSVLPYKKGAFNRGSIPGSIHLNWSNLADLNGDHRIKSEKDLRYDLKSKGIDSNKEIILYCHSGSRTSHTFYVLKHVLGYENVKNYDGSWIDWSYRHSVDNSIPIQQICSEDRFQEMIDSINLSLNNYE